jgi:hypothetical protein
MHIGTYDCYMVQKPKRRPSVDILQLPSMNLGSAMLLEDP